MSLLSRPAHCSMFNHGVSTYGSLVVTSQRSTPGYAGAAALESNLRAAVLLIGSQHGDRGESSLTRARCEPRPPPRTRGRRFRHGDIVNGGRVMKRSIRYFF
jgi:hypothetical protein